MAITNAEDEMLRIFFKNVEDLKRVILNTSKMTLVETSKGIFKFSKKIYDNNKDYNLSEKKFNKKTQNKEIDTFKKKYSELSIKEIKKELNKKLTDYSLVEMEDRSIMLSCEKNNTQKITDAFLVLEKKNKQRKSQNKSLHKDIKNRAKEKEKEFNETNRDKYRQQEKER